MRQWVVLFCLVIVCTMSIFISTTSFNANAQVDEENQNLRELVSKLNETVKGYETRIGNLENLNIETVPPDKDSLGDLPRNIGEVHIYPLPDVIPDTTREILIFAYVHSGNMASSNVTDSYEIYTDEHDQDVLGRFVLGFFTYPQDTVSFNSQTFWLPMPSNRIVKARLSGSNISENGRGSNVVAFLRVLGYR